MRIVLLVLLSGLVSGQEFEVASIREHTGPILSVGVDVSGQRATASAMSARELITYVYGLREYQVHGGEPWISRTRWDIRAVASSSVTLDNVRQMLRALLEERFGLALHHAMEEIPCYLMTIAKGGHKLKPPSPFAQERSTFAADGAIWQSASLDILGAPFPLHLSRPLINRTGLDGRFDFAMKFKLSLEEAQGLDGESIFTAMEEQLGLHVEPGRAMVETVVVDRITLPSDN
jgi:uncharacterized protein (TIGR03435 family)